MAYPNIIYGDYGDERAVSTSRNDSIALGAIMVLPDGREFRYGRVGGTALVQGKLYQGEAYASGTGNINDIAVIAGSAQAGALTMSVTMSATGAMATDQYKDGYVFAASSADVGGAGYMYKIKSCASAAAGSTAVITLYEPIKATIAGGTTTVGLRVNEFFNCLLTTADTVGVAAIAGVSCATAAASSYCWFQTKGPAAAFTDNTTLIVGTPVTSSTTVAGAVATWTVAAADTAGVRNAKGVDIIGRCLSVSASAEYSLVDLKIK